MYVELCWKTKDTKKGRINVSQRMTIGEAMKRYKEEIEPKATVAYLRRFDGTHHIIHKRLKR